MSNPAYRTAEYRAEKQRLKEMNVICCWCGVRRATTPDHDPPLVVAPTGPWRLVPSCAKCNYRRGQRLGVARRAKKAAPVSVHPFPSVNWW